MNKTEQNKSEDTYSYKGWIISDSFLKRCFGIFGHYLVANLIISMILMILGLIFAFTIGGLILSNTVKNGNTYFERGEDGLSFEFGTIDEDEEIFCTQDAKLCPDGSYVSRIAPSCEFAACPNQNAEISEVNYNQDFIIKPEEQAMTSNGMLITLTEIKDERCPADVECVWEGEFRTTFNVISPVDDVRTFMLGSVRETEQEHWGYLFSLNSVSEGEVEMVVRETTTS